MAITVRPTDFQAEGCPVVDKTRSLIIDKGVSASAEWTIRDRNGNTVNLAEWLCDESVESSDSDSDTASCGSVKLRLADALSETTSTFYETDGVAVTSAEGIVSAPITERVSDAAGIYRMDWGIYDGDGKLILVDKGLLVVERGLFGTIDSSGRGSPSISDIRLALRDTAIENTLLDNVEFSDTEILYAMIRPVEEWNEAPPPIGSCTPHNFPFRTNWINAICAYLLQIAAHHYRRNKLNSAHGGLQLADKDRDNPYLQVSQMMMADWRRFIAVKKVQLNAARCYGSVGSDYGRGY